MKKGLKYFGVVALGLAVWAVGARNLCAFTLDWDTLNWDSTQQWGDGTGTTPNPVTTTFTNVDGSGINVTVSITRGTNTTETEAQAGEGAVYPTDTSTPVTIAALSPDPQSLHISLDSTNGGSDPKLDLDYVDETGDDYLLITISFSQSVRNINFELWDIDLGNSGTSQYQDLVLFNTSVVAPTLSTVSTSGVSAGLDVEVVNASDAGYTGFRGRGTHTATNTFSTNAAGNENDTFGSGRGLVNYGTNVLSSVSFKYGSGTGARNAGGNIALGDMSLQRITIADINFSSVVPEAGTTLATGCLALLTMTARRRRSSMDVCAG